MVYFFAVNSLKNSLFKTKLYEYMLKNVNLIILYISDCEKGGWVCFY
jgi:hypothetical protein